MRDGSETHRQTLYLVDGTGERKATDPAHVPVPARFGGPLSFLGARAVLGVEEVAAGAYRRSVRTEAGPAIVTAKLGPNHVALTVTPETDTDEPAQRPVTHSTSTPTPMRSMPSCPRTPAPAARRSTAGDPRPRDVRRLRAG